MDILYKNLKDRRIALGLSQGALAEKLGYADKSAIARIEAGQTDLGLEKLKAFAKALNISPMVLLGIENSDPVPPGAMIVTDEDDKLILHRYHKLSSGRKVDIKNQMDMYIRLDSSSEASSL